MEKVKEVTYSREWDSPNGKTYYFNITFDSGLSGQFSTNKKDQTKFRVGDEYDVTIVEKVSKTGTKYNFIDKVKSKNFDPKVSYYDRPEIQARITAAKSLELAIKEVLIDENLVIEGYSITDWIEDLKSKYNILNINTEKERLRKLEDKLHELLSVDTKISIELETLKKQI